jgi:hypothetical protein
MGVRVLLNNDRSRNTQVLDSYLVRHITGK